MIKKVPLLTQHKGGDGRYRPGYSYGALDLARVTYMEATGTWQDKPITCVHLDNGDIVEVLLSLDEVIDLSKQDD